MNAYLPTQTRPPSPVDEALNFYKSPVDSAGTSAARQSDPDAVLDRSERQLVQHIDYNLLYRWFVGLDMDDKVWDHSTFTKNRDRLLNETVARAFFGKVLGLAQWHGLVSSDHFSVDDTLIEAWQTGCGAS